MIRAPRFSPFLPPPPLAAATLMVQGTIADAGKATLVASLCRMVRRRELMVGPYKLQNMALV